MITSELESKIVAVADIIAASVGGTVRVVHKTCITVEQKRDLRGRTYEHTVWGNEEVIGVRIYRFIPGDMWSEFNGKFSSSLSAGDIAGAVPWMKVRD